MTSPQGGQGTLVNRAEVFSNVLGSPKERAGHNIMDPSFASARPTVRLVHTTAVMVLSILATREPTLTKPASQLKLWGVGLFEDGPLDLDDVLSNQKVAFIPMRDCVLQFLITILAHGEQLCKAWYDVDDSVRALGEEIAVVFELEDLVDKVLEGRQDVVAGPNDVSEIAAIVQRLFALSPSIRRARVQQSLQIQKEPNASVEIQKFGLGNEVNFTSMDTLLGKINYGLEVVAGLIRRYDDAAAAADEANAKVYSTTFDAERKRLTSFYDMRCKEWPLREIEKSVLKCKDHEVRLARALHDLITHRNEALVAEQIDAIIALVGDTATKIMQRNRLQPLEVYHGCISVDATGSCTIADTKSRDRSRTINASLDAVRQQ